MAERRLDAEADGGLAGTRETLREVSVPGEQWEALTGEPEGAAAVLDVKTKGFGAGLVADGVRHRGDVGGHTGIGVRGDGGDASFEAHVVCGKGLVLEFRTPNSHKM